VNDDIYKGWWLVLMFHSLDASRDNFSFLCISPNSVAMRFALLSTYYNKAGNTTCHIKQPSFSLSDSSSSFLLSLSHFR
jgi:hypothetical protein